MSREWTETLTKLDITPDPTARQAHKQLGDFERTVQTRKRSAEETSRDPALIAQQIMSVRAKGHMCTQSTNVETTESVDLATMEQHLKIRTAKIL